MVESCLISEDEPLWVVPEIKLFYTTPLDVIIRDAVYEHSRSSFVHLPFFIWFKR